LTTGLRALYRRQQFFPGWFGIFVNPFYFARAGLADAMKAYAPSLKGRLLDVGCGTEPYRELFTVSAYIGLDIDSPVSRQRNIADYFYDGEKFPFENASFDSVLCNEVLEHVFNPDEFIREIARILKPGGKILLTVPFVWDEHEQPFDYARYSSFGLRALLEKQGLNVMQQSKLGTDAAILFQLANAYLFKITQNSSRITQLLLAGSVMALINLLGLLARRLLPDNPDLYLDNVVLAEKVAR
jgi:SAM-dependent methyltransferase